MTTPFFKYFNYLQLLLFALLLGVILYFVLPQIFFSYPIEYREGHVMATTSLLLNNERPYTIDSYPYCYNSYGILFSYIVYPFTKIWGNTLIVNRIINALFFVITLLILFFYRKKTQINVMTIAVFICSLFLIFLRTNTSVRPDGLGTFLYTLSIVVAVRNDYSHKSILYASILSILAFYAKPYFVLSWYLVSFVLLLKDWKAFLVYNVWFHLLFLLITAIVNHYYPLYFYETIFAYGNSFNSWSYSLDQMRLFLTLASPLLIFVFNRNLIQIVKENKYVISMLCWIILLLLYPLGLNLGALLTYHSQLLLPLMVLFILEIKYDIKHLLTILSLISIILLFMQIRKIYSPYITNCQESDISEWMRLEQHVRDKQQILNSPIIAPILIEQGKTFEDDGVSAFIFGYQQKEITKQMFGLDSLLLEKKSHYINQIKNKIEKQDYDAIILTHLDSHYENLVNPEKYQIKDSCYVNLYCNFKIMVYIYDRKNTLK